MGFRIGVLFTVAVAIALSSASAAPPAAGPARGKVKLTYDSGKGVTCLTHRWANGGVQATAKSSTVKLSIAGQDVQAAGWKSGTDYRIGLDTNGDGMVNTEEYRGVSTGGSVVLTGKCGDRQVSVRCMDVSMRYDEKKGKVLDMKWRMQGVYGWVGEIDSVKIRILDENLDGKYAHNGADAIQIGDGKLALPLRREHRIGKDFYELKIAPDGESLEFTKIPDPQVGLVLSPFKGKYLIGLVLDSGVGAFDIQACSRTGIPAGTYNVAYGAVGDPRAPVALYRQPKSTVEYEIQADKKNLLRIGPPLQLVFRADFKEENKDKTDKKDKKTKKIKTNKQIAGRLRVRSPDRVIGAGGELYGPVIFPNARSTKGRPSIVILKGGKTLVKTVMPEKNGLIGEYVWELPRRISPLGIRVVMAAPVRGLGKVMGARTLKQIHERTEVAPPKTDKPSVATTPWKRPARSARIARNAKPPIGRKPRPAAPKPKVKPKTKRPKPVSTDEQKAERLLQLARSYEKMKLHAKYVEMLKKTVEKYPDTNAAIVAKELLNVAQ